MPHAFTTPTSRGLRRAALLGVTAAAVALAVLTGIAAARTFALATATHATVRNTAGRTIHETIVVTPSHRAVYWLTGDTRRHPECTARNGCFLFWPPVTTRSTHPARPAAIRGRLTTWRRDGFLQLVLDGHPLYRYAGDSARNLANGEGIRSFGGTWHVVRPSGIAAVSSPTPSMPAPPSTTTTPQLWY